MSPCLRGSRNSQDTSSKTGWSSSCRLWSGMCHQRKVGCMQPLQCRPCSMNSQDMSHMLCWSCCCMRLSDTCQQHT